MNIKLIITDLDGTLLNDNKEINPEFWRVHEELQKRGVLFSIASGRQLYTMEQQFERIKQQTYFIAENGTIMKKGDEILHTNPLSKDDVDQLVRLSREVPKINPIVCGVNSAYIENTEEPFYAQAKKYYFKLEVVDDLTQVDDTVLKIAIADPLPPETHSYLHFKKYESKYKISVSGPDWMDIASSGSSKGAAISMLKKDLGIKHDEIMIFGDFPNDLEMMSMGAYSYAMKNAHPQILAAAKFVTEKDNNENGVVETIKTVLLQSSKVGAVC